jgi:hypothetical protein
MAERTAQSNEPYCSNCGYVLSNLTESSKCPECGKPLVEVLARRNMMFQAGKRYRSKATIFGLPVIHIAIGPKDGEMRGKAKGFIAIGDIATGWLAIGGISRGVVAVGGVAVGLFSMGGLSLGLLMAMGGLGLGGMSMGGLSLGGISTGGGAIGYVAQGGGAVGYYARGGSAIGAHTIKMTPGATNSPEAQSVFDSLSWFFGAWPPNSVSMLQPVLVLGGTMIVLAGILAMIAFAARSREPAEQAAWTGSLPR